MSEQVLSVRWKLVRNITLSCGWGLKTCLKFSKLIRAKLRGVFSLHMFEWYFQEAAWDVSLMLVPRDLIFWGFWESIVINEVFLTNSHKHGFVYWCSLVWLLSKKNKKKLRLSPVLSVTLVEPDAVLLPLFDVFHSFSTPQESEKRAGSGTSNSYRVLVPTKLNWIRIYLCFFVRTKQKKTHKQKQLSSN